MLQFDIEKTVRYWFESAEYDMSVVDALYQTGKYPYALFIGHLALGGCPRTQILQIFTKLNVMISSTYKPENE